MQESREEGNTVIPPRFEINLLNAMYFWLGFVKKIQQNKNKQKTPPQTPKKPPKKTNQKITISYPYL